MNNLTNDIRLTGVLRNVSLRDRRLWAILVTGGQYPEYVPVVAFASKDEDANGFAARVAALKEGALVSMAGRLSLSRELDENQKPVLHPRTGHPLRRPEVVVYAFAPVEELMPSQAPQQTQPAAAPAPRQKARAALPPPLAAPAPATPARSFNVPQPRTAPMPAPTAAAGLGTPPVPWG